MWCPVIGHDLDNTIMLTLAEIIDKLIELKVEHALDVYSGTLTDRRTADRNAEIQELHMFINNNVEWGDND